MQNNNNSFLFHFHNYYYITVNNRNNLLLLLHLADFWSSTMTAADKDNTEKRTFIGYDTDKRL